MYMYKQVVKIFYHPNYNAGMVKKKRKETR